MVGKSLLRRRSLQPQELLLSLIIRLTWLNCYETPREIERLVFEGPGFSRGTHDNLALPMALKTYERLFTLTCIEPITLYNSTYHRFASAFAFPPHSMEFFKLPGNVPVPRLPVPYGLNQLRPLARGQFCPFCLKDAAYFPLRWAPTAVSVCLSHKCLLVDQCPSCSQETSIYSIVTARCIRCQADITEAKAPSIAFDDVGLQAQHIIQSWLMGEEHSREIRADLPRQPPAILYKVVEGLQSCAKLTNQFDYLLLQNTNTQQHHSTFHYQESGSLSPYESYCLYATAYSAIVDWPKGFYAFLNRYRERREQQSKTRYSRVSRNPTGSLIPGLLHNNLGEFYSRWIRKDWAYPEFTFLQSAFEHYITDNYWLNSSVARTKFGKQRPEIAQRIEFITISEAAELLNIPHKTIELLLSSGQLTSCTLESGKERLLRKKELLYLHNVWYDHITLNSAAVLLGLSEQIVVELIEVGLLPIRYSMQERLTRAAVIECLEKIAKHIKYRPIDEAVKEHSLLDLESVVQSLFSTRLSVVTVFLQIALGNLEAYQTNNQPLRLGELLFESSEIEKLIEAVKAHELLLSRDEAAKLLGIEEVILVKWVKEHHITPFSVQENVHYFTRSSVDALTTIV